MAFKVVIGKAAQIDLKNSVDWYAGESLAALGHFLEDVGGRLNDLAERPESFAPLRRRPVYRRAKLRRFPYLLIFRMDAARNRVFVAALIHEKRNPGVWIRQLR